MKIKTLLSSAAAVFAIGGIAQAQTYIEITGATAFRTAAVNAINNAFASGGNAFTYGFANTSSSGATTNLTNGSMQIWKGTFPGITGITVVRTSWNGSVEGIRAVAQPNTTVNGASTNPLYLKESILTGNLTSGGGNATTVRFHSDTGGSGAVANAANYELATSDLSFSDCAQSMTPVSGLTLSGGPVGVVVFTMIASKSWSVDKLQASNGNATAEDIAYANRMPTSVSSQQFRTMAELGYAPMSFFTGNASDTTRVYLTGRNDGSGTRTSYLSETGVGAAKPITQYIAHDRSVSGSIPYILKVPAGGGFNFQGVATTTYSSTVWGSDIDGNGGHVSGGDLRDDLSKSTASTAVWEFVDLDESGTYTVDEDSQVRAAEKLYLLTWITYSDARTARGSGLASARNAEVLGYNGVILPGLSGDTPPSTMGSADKALVANGLYTAWNFQQLYYINATAGASTVFTELKSRLNSASVIGSAGMALNEMNVNRTVDGGTILPGAPAQ
ncbi:MAG: hypothetical protein NTZ94_01990 [Verrucomicrobia bacterium]|nr:hypothetical protein [Verrucomicrobiota bacterium]